MRTSQRNKLLTGAFMALSIIALMILAVYAGRGKVEGEADATDIASASNFGSELTPGHILPQMSAESYPMLSHEGEVGKNMNFFDLMTSHRLSPQLIHEMVNATRDIYNLRRIYPGQTYRIYSGAEGTPERFEFSINEEEYLEISIGPDTVKAVKKTYPSRSYRKYASGVIKSSLFESIQTNHIPFELATKLNDIFAWDIDFFSDIRANDYYRLIYEEKEITKPDGSVVRKIDKIVAVEFNCDGNKHYAFLFKNDGESFFDYFDEDGKSLRKQLLRAPLSFTRISSGFSYRRFHPVLHHYRSHLGIDYAAPPGTPVMSTGDGTVIKASYTRANGNYVKIRHNSNFISYYLHLSRFAKGIKYGAKVKQGQTIGYVGSTGYATGPHLDYRIKKNGKFVNPRRLKLPPAEPVAETVMDSFSSIRDGLLTELNRIEVGGGVVKHFTDNDMGSGGSVRENELEPAVSQARGSNSR